MNRRRLIKACFITLGLWALGAVALVVLLQQVPLDLPAPPRFESAPESSSEPYLSIPDRMRRGEALASLLHRNGFTAREVHDLAEALSQHMNIRHLRPGDEVEIFYGRDGEAESVQVSRGAFEAYEVRRESDGWVGEPVQVELERREVVRHGRLRGSLFASMGRMGETAVLVIAFAEVFAWDFDFYTQSRPGDHFSLVVDKLYLDGKLVGYGDLKAARYVSGNTDLAAFLYQDPTEKKDFYDINGKSMRKAFLKTPLKFQRISSRFSYSRLHPVHKRRMPHLGVDYAAPTGTPVYSVASGVVSGISRKGGGGNQVNIKHAMGYISKYLHLSRFARGLRVGKRVQQKEVIGYVGSTGVATGPHLDFRLVRHGEHVNPLKQIFPPGPPVPDDYMPDFRRKMGLLANQLNLPAGVQLAAAE